VQLRIDSQVEVEQGTTDAPWHGGIGIHLCPDGAPAGSATMRSFGSDSAWGGNP